MAGRGSRQRCRRRSPRRSAAGCCGDGSTAAPAWARARSRLARRPRRPVAGQSSPFLRIRSAGLAGLGSVSVLERRQEPVEQAPDGHRPACHAEQQAGQQEGREPEAELQVEPVSAERTRQGRHEEDEPDLCEEGEISPSPPGLDHAPPGKATGVYQRLPAPAPREARSQGTVTSVVSVSVVVPSRPGTVRLTVYGLPVASAYVHVIELVPSPPLTRTPGPPMSHSSLPARKLVEALEQVTVSA